ncbi:hypothetical protein I79_005278 [Cricetulus griseus]|uniref:Uncharacterized protein n=1 Tax=Cricetulus griseus TaxID=10029 RepID=G3H4R8_CRIGR|nr:hypothetical protein I79_005278 [Cricetulus griseus]
MLHVCSLLSKNLVKSSTHPVTTASDCDKANDEDGNSMDLRTLSGLRAKGWYSHSKDGLTDELWEQEGDSVLGCHYYGDTAGLNKICFKRQQERQKVSHSTAAQAGRHQKS